MKTKADNVIWWDTKINKEKRSSIKKQKPCILWFTGLSGSGKSVTADAVEHLLFEKGYHTFILDGDNMRYGLNRDLGFSNNDRIENIRRNAEVAKLMVNAGLIVMVTIISPFSEQRKLARNLFSKEEFIEIYMNTPLDLCERRDAKGLYKKARKGEIKEFTGIDSPYEPPETPEITLYTKEQSIIDNANVVIDYLKQKDFIL